MRERCECHSDAEIASIARRAVSDSVGAVLIGMVIGLGIVGVGLWIARTVGWL